jgi:hypothetical protein
VVVFLLPSMMHGVESSVAQSGHGHADKLADWTIL